MIHHQFGESAGKFVATTSDSRANRDHRPDVAWRLDDRFGAGDGGAFIRFELPLDEAVVSDDLREGRPSRPSIFGEYEATAAVRGPVAEVWVESLRAIKKSHPEGRF